MIVGITGNYCSGKSIASVLFLSKGYRIIDVDTIGHEALRAKQDEIVRVFGRGILKEGSIDRTTLGSIIFSNSDEKKKLEAIVHPLMIKQVKLMVRNEKKCVINAALLVEMCLFVLCDFVIGIDVSEVVAIQRGMARDGISRHEAVLRLRAQIPLKEKLQFVDKVIENNKTREEFEKEVRKGVDLMSRW